MKTLIKLWKDAIKPLLFFFIAGVAIMAGFRTTEWLIPAKPVEYRICVQDAAGDYMCEVYK